MMYNHRSTWSTATLATVDSNLISGPYKPAYSMVKVSLSLSRTSQMKSKALAPRIGEDFPLQFRQPPAEPSRCVLIAFDGSPNIRTRVSDTRRH